MGLDPVWLLSFYKREIWTERQICTEGRWCAEIQGKVTWRRSRDCSNACNESKIDSKPPKVKRKPWNKLSLKSSKITYPAITLISNGGTINLYCLRHQFVVLCYSSLSKHIQEMTPVPLPLLQYGFVYHIIEINVCLPFHEM